MKEQNMNDKYKTLLRQMIEVIDAHEITCFSCDRDGETHCDCLERLVEEAKKELAKETII
jgi:hypothetical protein